MKNEEINRAIAEHLGWSEIRQSECWQVTDPPEDKVVLSGVRPDGKLRAVPNFSSDLNAMHEAEKALDDFQHDRMRNQLWLLMIKETKGEKTSRRVHSAEAHERAEAFLRAIGKWVK